MSTGADLLGPKTAAVEVAVVRLRRVLRSNFGDTSGLDTHLELMDARGVLYATHAAHTFADQSPLLLFGLVRHVLRAQSSSVCPNPDVKGWLAAGRPEHDGGLSRAWNLINLCRYGRDPIDAPVRSEPAGPAIRDLDEVLRRWSGGSSNFATIYGRI